ncbi:phosphonate ABC transporter ATP-binding protein [Salmonella enterica subsp. arizonae]|uniref:Phosphonate ABC transporter ATP-binding protein n=1 Tax=Salmonella enterica subsp. arizonae TaxID=59203 RepID=A0A379SNY3_SALER|nr:phosphonate ABC transporter ATP-binding protein [Salmonella enterica subsp. arizonae]
MRLLRCSGVPDLVNPLLLRMVAGLVEPDLGSIVCCDLPVNGPGKNTSMVFQSFALFPWLNVFDSVAFGLQAQGISSDEVGKRTMDMLDLIGLSGYEKAYPPRTLRGNAPACRVCQGAGCRT